MNLLVIKPGDDIKFYTLDGEFYYLKPTGYSFKLKKKFFKEYDLNVEEEYSEYISVCNYLWSLKCKLLNEYKYNGVVYFTVMVVKKLQDLLSESIKMEINELDEKLIPKYLVTENNFLESEIAKVRAKLEENNKKIESILNLKNISRDDIKTIKTESYAKVARLISYCRVSEPNSIFYFYNGDDKELTSK